MPDTSHVLNAEMHARPTLEVRSPATVCHSLHMLTERSLPDYWRRVEAETLAVGQPAPVPGNRYHVLRDAGRTVKWEQHTECFATTVISDAQNDKAWLDDAAAFSRVRIDVVKADGDGKDLYVTARGLLGDCRIVGGWMSDRHASVWTGYQQDSDGCARFVILDTGCTPGRLGRLVHRLLDIEDYRLLTLKTLPEARAIMARLGGMEPELARITSQIAARPDAARQEELLKEISAISAEIEYLAAENVDRLAASRAYHAIVQERLGEIREEIQDGHERMSVFLSKRLDPAIRTCNAARDRLDAMAGRVSRAVNLLGTLVDLANRKQNKAILQSMEARAKTQIQLQMAVEGLSIIAISYYLTGLIAWLLKGASKSGLPIVPETGVAVAVPLVVLAVWAAIRRIKRNFRH